MDEARTLDDLIDAARRAHASALHISRGSETDAIYARLPRGLDLVRQVPTQSGWFDQAVAHHKGAVMDDRVVIAIDGVAKIGSGLANLGMPGGMCRLLEAVDGPQGGVFVVASRAESDRRTLMVALARPGEGRYAPWVAPDREAIGTAARMDCDAMLIDGIADRATAALAFEIAQTGHRIVLGIAAGDAIGAIAHLRSLRVERYMLGSTLRAVAAARSVPGLCAGCRLPGQTRASESALLGVDAGTVIYRPAGCGACDGTGYGAPVMVFEAIVADGPLRRLLVEGADAGLIARHAFLRTPSLAGSARLLAREGAITAEAAIRVARDSGTATSLRSAHPHILGNAPARAGTG